MMHFDAYKRGNATEREPDFSNNVEGSARWSLADAIHPGNEHFTPRDVDGRRLYRIWFHIGMLQTNAPASEALYIDLNLAYSKPTYAYIILYIQNPMRSVWGWVSDDFSLSRVRAYPATVRKRYDGLF